MPVQEVLKLYGPHGLYGIILWRVLVWVGKRVDVLLTTHQKSQIKLRRQMSCQTLLMKGMLALLKDHGVTVSEIHRLLQGSPHVAPPLCPQVPAAAPPALSPTPLGYRCGSLSPA